jgi:hypothetical protein
VELYFHLPIHLHGIVFFLAQDNFTFILQKKEYLKNMLKLVKKWWTSSDLGCDKNKKFKSNVVNEKKLRYSLMVRDQSLKIVKGLRAVNRCFAEIHDHGCRTDYISPI